MVRRQYITPSQFADYIVVVVVVIIIIIIIIILFAQKALSQTNEQFNNTMSKTYQAHIKRLPYGSHSHGSSIIIRSSLFLFCRLIL